MHGRICQSTHTKTPHFLALFFFAFNSIFSASMGVYTFFSFVPIDSFAGISSACGINQARLQTCSVYAYYKKLIIAFVATKKNRNIIF